jgi:hypothetical protein
MIDREIDTAVQLRSAQWQLGEFGRVVKATIVSRAVRKALVFWRITMARSDVLIAGAGPTGLVLVLCADSGNVKKSLTASKTGGTVVAIRWIYEFRLAAIQAA